MSEWFYNFNFDHWYCIWITHLSICLQSPGLTLVRKESNVTLCFTHPYSHIISVCF